MTQSKPAKSHYSEIEAAAVVGISVEELRHLIRQHITGNGNREENGDDAKATTFQPSDLVLLRILARQHASTPLAAPVH
jgi:hypothetical protein